MNFVICSLYNQQKLLFRHKYIRIMKLLTIILIMLPGLSSAQFRGKQNTYVFAESSFQEISGCLSNYLGKSGYSLGNLIHIPGVNDELPVFSHQYNRITGVFRITDSLYGGQEKVVGLYNVTDESLPCLQKILQNCQKTLVFREEIQQASSFAEPRNRQVK
ncbi:hypothetical protein DUA46_25155 [Salmonella enterica subsp. enterica]|nr:hypothetical protein [Salmonella enterica subsp. enterica serovar Muenchen]EBN2843528.1 hypothetical protein [Salmonella enterica]